MLAEIAAVFGVLPKPFNVQFLRLTDNVANAILSAEVLGLFSFPLGERTGGRGDGDHMIPQHIMGEPQ